MATFCNKCGSPIEENQKFCNKCGAPTIAEGAPGFQARAPHSAAVVAPPTQRATPASPAPTQAAAVPAAAPAKKGNTALKIILAVLGVFIVIGVMAIGSCFYIAHKINQNVASIAEHVRPTTGNTSTTPDMHLSDGGAGSQAAASATVDVPPYPGSTPTKSGGELSAGITGSVSAQEYETPDSTNKVMEFYKNRLGSKINIVESEGKSVFNFISSNGMTTVTVSRDEGTDKTKINIARIGK
ncbi:MAG TPA: zinc-ribbon domain-containing protein [Terriglobia bacterium]|nr:zinc-ribbon domain-containing protein [Terriglobia bacterium]